MVDTIIDITTNNTTSNYFIQQETIYPNAYNIRLRDTVTFDVGTMYIANENKVWYWNGTTWVAPNNDVIKHDVDINKRSILF